MNFAVVEVDPDTRVTNGLGKAAISSIAHVSSLRGHNDWLLGDHVDGPLLVHLLLVHVLQQKKMSFIASILSQ